MTSGDVAAVADQIESYVRTHFRVAKGDTLFSRDIALFELGYVDSVGVIELLAFIAERFGVDVPDDVLLSEEFSSINGMADTICRMGSQRSGAPA